MNANMATGSVHVVCYRQLLSQTFNIFVLQGHNKLMIRYVKQRSFNLCCYTEIFQLVTIFKTNVYINCRQCDSHLVTSISNIDVIEIRCSKYSSAVDAECSMLQVPNLLWSPAELLIFVTW